MTGVFDPETPLLYNYSSLSGADSLLQLGYPGILTSPHLLWCIEMVSTEAEDRMSHSPEVILHVLQKKKKTGELLDT